MVQQSQHESHRGKRRTKRRRSTAAKIRAIQRRYISRSDLCPFFHRFLSLSGEKDGGEEPFGSQRAASDKTAASISTSTLQRRWKRDRNDCRDLSTQSKLGLLLESELLATRVRPRRDSLDSGAFTTERFASQTHLHIYTSQRLQIHEERTFPR